MRRLWIPALLVAAIVASCNDAEGCRCGVPSSETSQAIVPPEVADDEALAPMTSWLALPTFGEGRYVQQSSEDRNTGEPVEIPLWGHGNRDFNNFICRGAKADAPESKVAFHYDLQSCPEAYVEGLVLARFEGSGRLARLWMTAASIRKKLPDRELVRIYVDDATAPLIEAPLSEMLTGKEEIFAPPFGAGSSRFLAWYYPVVFSKRLIVSIDRTGTDDLYFHQTDVVLDSVTRARSAPSTRLPGRDAALRALKGDPVSDTTERTSEWQLGAGESGSVELDGPATIVSAKLRVPKDQMEALQRVQVSVQWDDEGSAIDTTLANLFAAWSQPAKPGGLALSSSERDGNVELTLGLPMPFEKRAHWTIENWQGAPPVSVAMTFTLARTMPPSKWGHLYVQRNQTAAPPQTSTHPIASADGRGRLIGVCAELRGHGMLERRKRGHPFHFLEGDETIRIDGERRTGGTGTEDYFNGAFYFEDGPSATPFAQVWNIFADHAEDKKNGGVSTCRWHVFGDAIDFEKSLEATLEMGPGVRDTLDRYVTVAYLYR